MPTVIKGSWDQIKLQEQNLAGHYVRVLIDPEPEVVASNKMIKKGMFPQLLSITDEDFKLAEIHVYSLDDNA